MKTRFSACIELLFAPEADDPAERIRLAAAAGLPAVEFWAWRNKDLSSIAAALEETGLTLTGFVSEPMAPLTDPAQHDAFLAGLQESIAVARTLGSSKLIAQAGPLRPHEPREIQRAAIVTCLNRAAEMLKDTGVTLLLEPLNIRVDHPGYFLPFTPEALDIIDAVGRPEVRLLYDLYHSAVMGETPQAVLAGRIDRIGHVHLADAPGRQEPGTGTMDWHDQLSWLERQGYDGFVGLEYRPSRGTVDSLSALMGRSSASAPID